MAGKLRIRGAIQLVQVCNNGERLLKGAKEMNKLAIMEGERDRTLGIVVDQNGLIKDIG